MGDALSAVAAAANRIEEFLALRDLSAFETLLAAGVGDIRPADPRFGSGQDVPFFL